MYIHIWEEKKKKKRNDIRAKIQKDILIMLWCADDAYSNDRLVRLPQTNITVGRNENRNKKSTRRRRTTIIACKSMMVPETADTRLCNQPLYTASTLLYWWSRRVLKVNIPLFRQMLFHRLFPHIWPEEMWKILCVYVLGKVLTARDEFSSKVNENRHCQIVLVQYA